MTPPAVGPRLQVANVLSDTATELGQRLPVLLRAMVGPVLIAVIAVRIGSIGGELGLLYMLGQVVKWGLVIAFYVTVHRGVLLDETPPWPLGVRLGRREFRYLGYFAMITLWPAAAGVVLFYVGLMFLSVFGLTVTMDASTGAGTPAFWLFALPGLALSLYVAARLSPIMPAVAIDSPSKLVPLARQSWALAGRSVAVIFLSGVVMGTLFLIPVMILSLMVGLVVQSTGWLILDVIYITIVDFIGVALQAILLSVIYRHLNTKPQGGTHVARG